MISFGKFTYARRYILNNFSTDLQKISILIIVHKILEKEYKNHNYFYNRFCKSQTLKGVI